MRNRTQMRRGGILCCHFLRNLAFYRSSHTTGTRLTDSQFWLSVSSNFLEIAILEWCKLFGDRGGACYYTKLVINPDKFNDELLTRIGLTANQLSEYISQIRTYRDKFIAHLDKQNIFFIPDLSAALTCTIHLYDCMLLQEAATNTFHDAPKSAREFFQKHMIEGEQIYRNEVAASQVSRAK